MLKKIIFTVMLLAAQHVMAQDGAGISGPYGVYVYCGADLPKKSGYIIQRADAGKNNWRTIGATRFPADSAMFFSSYAEAAALNAGSPVIEEDQKSAIWKLAQKYSRIDSMGNYASFPAFRQALGTVFYDTTVVSGKIYDYKVSTKNPASRNSEILIDKVVFSPQVIKTDLKTVYAEPYEDKVMLRYYSAGSFISAKVKLYRRYYLQDEFKEVPAIFNVVTQNQKRFYILTDVNVKSGLVYNYFAVPYDQFGNPGVPSDTVRLTNFVQTHLPAVQRIKAMSAEKDHAIKLSWRFASPVKFLKSISIYRSESYDTVSYELIGTASGKDTLFTDKNVVPVKTYYYFIKLNGDRTSGNASARVPGMLKADRKSAVPLGLEAAAEAGKVTLSWSRPDNDIRGYYVYRSENDTSNMKQVSGFVPVSGKKIEIYTDTLLVSGKRNFFYSVRAENTSYAVSGRSNFASAAIQLGNIDKSPVALKAKNTGEAVMLYWSLIANQAAEVTGYNLYRKERDDSTVKLRLNKQVLLSTQNYFDDTTAVKGTSYRYELEVIRQTGAVKAEVNFDLEKPKILSPGGIIGRRAGQNVTLAWDATAQENVTGYKIYKLGQDGTYSLITTINGKEKSSFTYNAGNEKTNLTVVSTGTGEEESEPENWIGI